MSGLISNLATSSKALGVHSKGLEIAGKNLANINNRNYAKQRVEIGDRGSINTGIATESMGVEAMELRQNRDVLLDKSVMREYTASSGLEAAKKILESAESALGQFLDRTKDSTSIQNAIGASGGGISDALSDFFNQWESFSVKPNDVGEKQLLIAKAQILAEKINATDKNLKQVQTDTDSQLTTDVGIVNGILAEIAKTNEYIAKAELVKPYSAVDLRDQRQAKLEELSKYIDVSFGPIETIPATTPPTIDPNGLGQIDVKSNGVSLISGKDVLGKYEYAKPALSWNNALDNTKDKTFNAADLPGGKIGAQLTASTETVQTTRNQIKDLAIQLKQEVNNTYEANGGSQDFFNFSVTSTGLLNLQFNSSMMLSAGSAGGNSRALEVAELGAKIYSDSGKVELTSSLNHTLTNGDTVTIGEGTTTYKVEVLSDKSFMLRSNAVPSTTPATYSYNVPSERPLVIKRNGSAVTTAEIPSSGVRNLNFAGSFSTNFNTTVTELAQKLNTTNIRLEDQKLSEEMAVSNRDQFSGVSQDEELTDLMKFQRSFQATSRFINVVDNLLDQVVNRMGSF
jgi:flagellar hook-associated protein 1 FlgK